MEEHLQRAQRRAEEPRGGHAELAVVGDDGDVGHERELEAAAEGVARNLGNGDLRIAHEGVVEVEGLAVDLEAATLARAATLGALRTVAVPRVGVVHVGAGAENTAGTTQLHHLHVVVVGELVEIRAHLATHDRAVGVSALRVVDGDAGDARVVIAAHEYTTLAHIGPFVVDPRPALQRPRSVR